MHGDHTGAIDGLLVVVYFVKVFGKGGLMVIMVVKTDVIEEPVAELAFTYGCEFLLLKT